MQQKDNENTRGSKRPPLLTVLCILTFIGSGLSTMSFFAASLFYELFMEQLEVVYINMPESTFLLDIPRDFFVISFFLSAFSLAGALLMWHLRKIGFHIYTSSQLVYLVLPMVYFGGETNPMLNIILTALFVYLYARNLRFMH
jgi:hypothetical protein